MKGCDTMPILIGLTLIIIVFLYFSKSRGEKAKKNSRDFWQKERESQFVPRKDISSLDYIAIPFESLPFCYYRPGTGTPVKLSDSSGSGDLPADFSESDGTFSVVSENALSANSSYSRAPEFVAPYAEELAGAEQEICALLVGLFQTACNGVNHFFFTV